MRTFELILVSWLACIVGASLAPGVGAQSTHPAPRGQEAAARSTPRSESRSKPNILLLYTDQQQLPAMGAYGLAPVKTPHMDRVARQGVLFRWSFTATPQCTPARAALMTGRYPHAVGAPANGFTLDPKHRSMGRIFADAGYETVYMGKWHLGGSPKDHGWQRVVTGRGERLAAAAADYLAERHDRPFLLFVSFIDPHDIYRFRPDDPGFANLDITGIKLPANHRDNLSSKPAPQLSFLQGGQGKRLSEINGTAWRRYIAFYDTLCSKVDAHCGTILTALADAGLEASTLRVVTSDHGDLAGAHGLPFKGPCMYDELITVPLAIAWPGRIPAGRTNTDLVVNVDLLPTLCDFAGITPPGNLHGRSLRPLLEGRSVPWRDAVIGQYYRKQKWVNPIRMIRTRRHKYVLYRRWGEELYDLSSDPAEMNNLADDPQHAKTKAALRKKLFDWMQRHNDPFTTLNPTDRQGRPIP